MKIPQCFWIGLVTAGLLGCEKPGIEALFVNGTEYLEFHKDGTVYQKYGHRRVTQGNYTYVRDSSITITQGPIKPNVDRYAYFVDSIVNENGKVFTRWGRTNLGSFYLLDSAVFKLNHSELLLQNLRSIGSSAFQYRRMPQYGPGAGRGSYLGFQLRFDQVENDAGTYEVTELSPDQITITGTSSMIPASIIMIFDSTGHIQDTKYVGSW